MVFGRTNGRKDNLVVNYGTTVEQAIKMYLYKLGEEESIDSHYSKNKTKKFLFVNNANKLNKVQKNVEDYFQNSLNPEITVNSKFSL